MTRAAELELLDLPTRRTQEIELVRGDPGLVQHERVQLVQRHTLSGGLHDDQAAMVAQPAAAAFPAEELHEAKALLVVLPPADFAVGVQVFSAFASGVSTSTGCCELIWTAHPMDDTKSLVRIRVD